MPLPKTRHRTLGLVQVAILNHIETSPDRAYGSAITDDVSTAIGRDLADAQVYIALRRLQKQGLLCSQLSPSAPSKGTRGRPRKYYSLTALGKRALEDAGAYILSDRPVTQSARVCRHGTGHDVRSCAFVVVDPGKRQLWASLGPPCEGNLQLFSLR